MDKDNEDPIDLNDISDDASKEQDNTIPNDDKSLICPKCQTENPIENTFCSKCGKRLIVKENRTLSKVKQKCNKKNLTIAGIVAGVIILFFVGRILLYNPVSDFESKISDNNYAGAMKVYTEKIVGNQEKAQIVKASLVDDASKTYTSFKDEKISYEKACDHFTCLNNTKLIPVEASDYLGKVNSLHSSRTAYKKAEEYLGNNDVINALAEYKKVISEDKNYEKAKEQIAANEKAYQEYINKLRDSQLIVVESAKVDEQSPQWKALYPDLLQAISVNKSDKTVKSLRMGFLGYDTNGYPVKIRLQFDYSGGSYEFVGYAEDVNTVPGASFGDRYGWKLNDPHGVSKVLACVKSATFYDGSTWENPYYTYWLEKYLQKPLS